jgi:hypothetical protein
MFQFLKALTYDGTRGTVLRLEDLGNCFLMSVVYLKPVPRSVSQLANTGGVADESETRRSGAQ